MAPAPPGFVFRPAGLPLVLALLVCYACLMTNTGNPFQDLIDARERNVLRMASQREVARLAGFTVTDRLLRFGALRHESGRLELTVTDDEVSWRVALLNARGLETGSVDLSNLSVGQFSAVLAGLLNTIPAI